MHLLTLLTLALAGLALAGDVWSTTLAMATGKAHETNPVMNWLMNHMGRQAALVVSHLGAFVAIALVHQWWMNAAAAVLFGYVTWHNLGLKALKR